MSTIAIRKTIRKSRKAIPPRERRAFDAAIKRRLIRNKQFRQAHSIACYIHTEGEVSTWQIIEQALAMGKAVYLPVIRKQGKLTFHLFTGKNALKKNRWGIDEPISALCPKAFLTKIDVVITPLVAFNLNGDRLGMGGGFYDRTFAFKQQRSRPPRLIGIAYDLQCAKHIQPEPWDVPLDTIITESREIRCRR